LHRGHAADCRQDQVSQRPPSDPPSGNLLDTRSKLARRRLKSAIVKRSIVIAGHKTSVSLEDAFWKGLKEIAAGRDMGMSDLVKAIDSERQQGNLSSAIRVFVLDFYRDQIFEQEKRGRTGEMLVNATVAARKPG
jgi:predicted DNA-binding ribbon-helix-helix protein